MLNSFLNENDEMFARLDNFPTTPTGTITLSEPISEAQINESKVDSKETC